MVQFLSIIFFLDFFNICWVFQNFPFFLCHSVYTTIWYLTHAYLNCVLHHVDYSRKPYVRLYYVNLLCYVVFTYLLQLHFVNFYCHVLNMLFRVVEAIRNVMAHGDARDGKWRGNRRLERVATTLALCLGTWSIHGLPADPHSSTASSRLNWLPHRFKWTRPFLWKTKSGFCACTITFQTCSTTDYGKSQPNIQASKSIKGESQNFLGLGSIRRGQRTLVS